MSIDQEFKQKAQDAAGLFLFKRPLSCVGLADFSKSAENDPDNGKDPEIYNGTFVSTHGFARLAYHEPTDTLCLVASKTPVNVRGTRVDEHIHATEDGLKKSYIIAAYRLKHDGANDERVGQHMRNALDKFGIEMGDRSEKHFRLFAASYTNPEPVRADVGQQQKSEIFTNGCVTYVLEPTQKGYRATFHAAAQREGGHFVPFTLEHNSVLRNGITKISKVIGEDPDYSAVRAKINSHWGSVSSKLWDQKSLYKGEGLFFNTKRVYASAVNYAHHNSLSAATTAVLCAGAYGYNPRAGLGAAVGATVIHTVAHKLTHDGLHGTLTAYERVKQAKARKDINAYPFNEDASDHFKIQTTENMKKLCPKMDLNRFSADEFLWLDAEQSRMLLDHERVEDGMQPENLRGLLVNAHLRGFTSTCLTLDKRTQIDIFQSGLVRLMHQPQKGKTLIYAQYRPELCDNEHMRLPNEYAQQFKGGLVRMEYDRNGSSFRDSIDFQTKVPFAQMHHEVGRVLFRNQPHMPQSIKEGAFKSVMDIFIDPNAYHQNDPSEDVCLLSHAETNKFAYTLPDVGVLD